MPWLVWLPAYLEPRVPGSCVLGSCPGWCGYLHALNLVSLVRVSLVRALLVCVVRVVGVPWFVCPGWKWLP